MELNPNKSNILPIGDSKINFKYMYSLQSKIIRKLTSMKDVTVQSNNKIYQPLYWSGEGSRGLIFAFFEAKPLFAGINICGYGRSC